MKKTILLINLFVITFTYASAQFKPVVKSNPTEFTITTTHTFNNKDTSMRVEDFYVFFDGYYQSNSMFHVHFKDKVATIDHIPLLSFQYTDTVIIEGRKYKLIK